LLTFASLARQASVFDTDSMSTSGQNNLFANPGQGSHWLTVKLVGKKTNRAGIGARIKATTAGDHPATVYRHVSAHALTQVTE
jgi:hypothetical protein